MIVINNKKNVNVKAITFTAIMAAIIFVFTFTLKIPLGTGYAHLGDTMIFLSILLLGGKRSAFASGIGAALADLAGGYAPWIVPTFVIKSVMAVICFLIAEKIFKGKNAGYIVGCTVGGLFQIVAYTVVKILMYGKAYAFTTLPELACQTAVGIVVAVVLIFAMEKSGASKKLKSMAKIKQKEN